MNMHQNVTLAKRQIDYDLAQFFAHIILRQTMCACIVKEEKSKKKTDSLYRTKQKITAGAYAHECSL